MSHQGPPYPPQPGPHQQPGPPQPGGFQQSGPPQPGGFQQPGPAPHGAPSLQPGRPRSSAGAVVAGVAGVVLALVGLIVTAAVWLSFTGRIWAFAHDLLVGRGLLVVALVLAVAAAGLGVVGAVRGRGPGRVAGVVALVAGLFVLVLTIAGPGLLLLGH